MNAKTTLRLVVGILLIATAIPSRAEEPALSQPPNIVIIFVDDIGYADIEPFGNQQVRTPNLNRLAEAGRKTRAFGVLPPLPLIRGTDTIETEPDQSQLTRRYTEESVRFIESSRDRPFLLYLPHTMVHFPLAASENFKGKSKMGLIGDTIEEIDWSVGRILETLDRCKLSENTLVIFTSDNGPAQRSAPPLRGNKGSVFEGGVRVPTIMRWPGHIHEGTTCDHLCGTIDVLPTIANLIGSEVSTERKIDGSDITSLLLEAEPAAVRQAHLYYSSAGKLAAIRDGEWKLMLGKSESALKSAGSLFNLKQDVGEKDDVANENPEIVVRLQAKAEAFDEEVKANRRPAGRTE